MLTAQRKQLIQTELDRVGKVLSGELADRFGLSEDTIRRDLRQLAADGLCRRVYGGAVAPSAGTLDQRHEHLRAEKARLAQAAVRVISPKQTLFIDAGSTNSAIARALPADMGLTVVTNAPDIAAMIATRRDVDLIVLGGAYAPDIGACLGPQTLAGMAGLRGDWLFLGSCGLDAEKGVTAFDQGEGAVKRAMAAVCDHVLAAVTTEKIGTAAPYRVLETENLGVLVAEQGPDLSTFARHGVEIRNP